MKETLKWQKIVDGLELGDEQRKVLKRFVLGAIRQQQPVALWLHGPRSSGKSTLARAISMMFTVDSVASITGYDLRRGRFALSSIYDRVAAAAMLTLLIVNATPVRAASTGLCEALVCRVPVIVDYRSKTVLSWNCDLPLLFISEGPPEADSGFAATDTLELTITHRKSSSVLGRGISANSMGRAVVRWALSQCSCRRSGS